MAMCIIAYIRDSWSGLSRGAMHAAVAATPAFAFQTVTASPPASDGPSPINTEKVSIPYACFFIRPPFYLLRWRDAQAGWLSPLLFHFPRSSFCSVLPSFLLLLLLRPRCTRLTNTLHRQPG